MASRDANSTGMPRHGEQTKHSHEDEPPAAPFLADLALLADPDTDPDAHAREWERTYTHFTPRLHRHFMREVPDLSDREDLIGEIWFRIVPLIDTLRHPSAMWAWLAKTGHRICIDRGRLVATARKAAAERPAEVSSAIMSTPIPDTLNALATEARPVDLQALEPHLALLSEQDRTLLILRASGHSHEQIAHSLPLPNAAASRKRLERVITQLRHSLALA